MAHAHLLSTWFNAIGKRGKLTFRSPPSKRSGSCSDSTCKTRNFSEKKETPKEFQIFSLKPGNYVFSFKVPENSSAVGAGNRSQ
jgi:hypothetical protein